MSNIPDTAPYFSIIADEASDVSNLDVRFVCRKSEIHEEFLGFVDCRRTTGEAVSRAILRALEEWSLDIKNCRGQAYDGAANMSSLARGTQAFIKQKRPTAVYIHCNAHCLNLVIVPSCSLTMIRNIRKDMNALKRRRQHS